MKNAKDKILCRWIAKFNERAVNDQRSYTPAI